MWAILLDFSLLVGSSSGRRAMTSRVLKLLRNDRGSDMIEYGLVCSLISIAAVLVLQALAPIVLAFWNQILAAIQTAG